MLAILLGKKPPIWELSQTIIFQMINLAIIFSISQLI